MQISKWKAAHRRPHSNVKTPSSSGWTRIWPGFTPVLLHVLFPLAPNIGVEIWLPSVQTPSICAGQLNCLVVTTVKFAIRPLHANLFFNLKPKSHKNICLFVIFWELMPFMWATKCALLCGRAYSSEKPFLAKIHMWVFYWIEQKYVSCDDLVWGCRQSNTTAHCMVDNKRALEIKLRIESFKKVKWRAKAKTQDPPPISVICIITDLAGLDHRIHRLHVHDFWDCKLGNSRRVKTFCGRTAWSKITLDSSQPQKDQGERQSHHSGLRSIQPQGSSLVSSLFSAGIWFLQQEAWSAARFLPVNWQCRK